MSKPIPPTEIDLASEFAKANCQAIAPRPLCRRFKTNKIRLPEYIPEGAARMGRAVCLGLRPWPLVLTGATGGGKTCMGLILSDNYAGLYFTTSEFCERARKADCGHLQSSAGYPVSLKEVWDQWRRAPLAVLDELGGRAFVSDHHFDCVLRAIDDREGQPLVVITNLTLEDLGETYDGRISSRLAAGTIVTFRRDLRVQPSTHGHAA